MTRPGPRVVSQDPYNAETTFHALRRPQTPATELFVRNHGDVPPTVPSDRLRVLGATASAEFDVPALRLLGSRTVTMVLECAGNGRSGLEPRPPGLGWGSDAVGCVEFRGVPLKQLLRKARIGASAGEVVFTGADRDGNGDVFARSLPLAKASHPDTLVAYELNGKPIPSIHGGPLRLVVPGWFAVASVKWLRSIEMTPRPFEGPYQRQHYWYRFEDDGRKDRPVQGLFVKSNVIEPTPMTRLRQGRRVRVWGWAWSEGPIKRVDVSLDGGTSWVRAKLGPRLAKYAWREWSLNWTPGQAGSFTVLSRATDARGATQPLTPTWNTQGYGNNAAARRVVEVAPRRPASRHSP